MSKSNYRKRDPKSQNDFIEELILQNYGEVLKTPITDVDGGFEELLIDDTVKNLTLPAGLSGSDAVGSATIMVEGEDGIIVRYCEGDTVPNATKGLFLTNGDILEVGRDQLDSISFISAVPAQAAKLQIQYYLSLELDL